MNQGNNNEKKFRQKEADARHGVVVLLVIYSLIGMDIQSRETEEEKRKATAMWLGWGIPFVLLAFFIITPEQDVLREQKQRG